MISVDVDARLQNPDYRVIKNRRAQHPSPDKATIV